MERDEFIKSLGLGVALVCTGSCFTGCGKKSNSPQPNNPGTKPPVGVASVDLNSQLIAVGSSAVANGVLFIRLVAGNAVSSFVATQALCPHQGGALAFIQANNYIQCSLHSSRYSTAGAILAQPNDGGTTSALKTYSLAINGNTLMAT